MWTRDHYFPESVAHATRASTGPMLPSARSGRTTVCIELRPFHDRQYNRDLVVLCERMYTTAPQLLDGRRLLFQVHDMPCSVLHVQNRQVA